MPNILGSFLAGQQAGQEQRRQRTLADLLPKAMGGDQGALAQVAGVDPRLGLQLEDRAQRQSAADRDAKMQQLELTSRAWRAASPEMRPQLYPSIVELTESVLPQFAGKIPREYNPAFEANIDKFLSGFAPVEDNTPASIRELQMLQANPELAALDMKRRTAGFDRPQLQTDAEGNAWWLSPNAPARPVLGPGSGAGGNFGIAETDNYVRSILGKAQVDPKASPEQQAEQLLPHLIQQESGGNPNAVSPKGAQGLTQVMPATGRDPGFGVPPLRDSSPQENVRFGRDYLTAMLRRYPGRPDLALAAYNAGPGVADRFASPTAQAGGLKFPTKGNASTEDKAANWQIVQGQDGTFYRVNKLTGETASAGVQGANALRMQDQHQKRADAVAGIEGAIRSTDETLQSLELLLTHPGRGSGTGLSSLLPSVPGTDRKNFDAQLATFKAQTFIPMVSQLKGMGALSDAEGKKLMDAVGALDPQMDESAFSASLNRIKAQLLRAQAAAYQKISALKRNQAPGVSAPTNAVSANRPQLPPGFSWED